MSQHSTLQDAIELAVKAHAGQEDPPGEPYILHSMRVMLALPDDNHELRMVGILHDAVERGSITLDDLVAAKYPRDVIKGIELMTHDKKKTSFADYVMKLKSHRLARAVKLADLTDNANLKYVDVPPDKPKKGGKRTLRYALSHAFLTDKISEKEYRRAMKDAE